MRDMRDAVENATRPAPGPLLRPLLRGTMRWRYLAMVALWVGAGVFLWNWWLQPANILNPLAYAAVTAPLVWVYWMQIYFVVVFLRARVSAAPDPEPGQYRVAMIVTKTPSEPFAVLQRTLHAMLAQDYPHDTWLADEDPSAETLLWCAAHGVRVSSRKGVMDYHQPTWPRRTRCKEGNLAYFYDMFGYDDYDIVSQLDADHVPQPGYLREILRPFADPAVGYVSAPSICSANATQSWAARTRLHVEAAFHGVFQTGYTGALAPMCIGSHYAVRTAALSAIGGLGPELAEDHSTSMLMNAGGWRGVHAIDAIAFGDGPATLTDMVTQEFQWSRSLLTLLLSHTSRYVAHLPPRLKFLFVFCQLWYPLFALTTALMYFMPIGAVVFDMRFADVTYPAFIGHSLPAVAVLTLFAFMLKWDGLMRPTDARVISWEKALFMSLQWPWVLWGCVMAVFDRLSGKFVDFRITPKGANVSRRLPARVLGVYVALALGCILPVLLVPGVHEARGFYLLLTFNAIIYTSIVGVIVVHHRKESGTPWRQQARDTITQFGLAAALAVLAVSALVLRAPESAHALAFGLEPLRLTRAEYVVSGAGSKVGGPEVRFRFDPGWN
ncbi:MAG: glycosyltransferase [Rhodobacteraceae bacterium]|nr:glycosyltransferase [Paracoccaceae bacterium]